MNIEAFLLCDAATDQRGKLNVLGAFDNIFAKELPVRHRACTIATRMRFSKIEAGDHTVRIFLIDADGNSIGPKLEGHISVRIGEGASTAVVNLILNMQNLEFKEFGPYQIDLAIDGTVQASLPLLIREVPGQQNQN
ncbi:MAG: DUF6941 family protein [Planctomycetota bacterium]|jgi:endonuclease YncB( thermonuclease family)